MTIQEAYKTGRQVRRTASSFGEAFGRIINERDSISFKYRLGVMPLDVTDIMADDWEVEPVSKQISADDVRKACNSVNKRILGSESDEVDYKYLHPAIEHLIKELGLE